VGSWEKKVHLAETTTKQHWPCQVRSETEHPCPHQAAVEIQGIPICESCAREQEAYYAMGELVESSYGLIKWRGHSRLTIPASRNMDERASELDGRLRRHAVEGMIWHREREDPARLG